MGKKYAKAGRIVLAVVVISVMLVLIFLRFTKYNDKPQEAGEKTWIIQEVTYDGRGVYLKVADYKYESAVDENDPLVQQQGGKKDTSQWIYLEDTDDIVFQESDEPVGKKNIREGMILILDYAEEKQTRQKDDVEARLVKQARMIG